MLLGYALWLFFASFVPAVYLFGWEHLGLSLSPFVPLGALLVPGILLAALGAQRVVSEARSLVWLALPLACMALDAKVNGASSPGVIAAALGIALVFLVFRRRDPRLIFACALASGLWYGTQNFLVRNPRSVARQSPLVDIVRSASADGTRFAWIAKEPTRILPPNQECWLGLESVHSYDSLSSRAYQDWSAEVSREPARTYGRKFDHIDGLNSISSEAFRRARIGVLLSLEDLRPVGYRLFARYGNVRVWQATECLPFASFANAPKLVVADERPNPESIRLQLREPGPEGLLVLSQQYHPHWSAQAEGRALECEPYQGVWQAVRVPAGVRSVSLEFHPWARFIWISQALFMLLALVLLLRSRLLRHRSVSVMELPPLLARAATPGGG